MQTKSKNYVISFSVVCSVANKQAANKLARKFDRLIEKHLEDTEINHQFLDTEITAELEYLTGANDE